MGVCWSPSPPARAINRLLPVQLWIPYSASVSMCRIGCHAACVIVCTGGGSTLANQLKECECEPTVECRGPRRVGGAAPPLCRQARRHSVQLRRSIRQGKRAARTKLSAARHTPEQVRCPDHKPVLGPKAQQSTPAGNNPFRRSNPSGGQTPSLQARHQLELRARQGCVALRLRWRGTMLCEALHQLQ